MDGRGERSGTSQGEMTAGSAWKGSGDRQASSQLNQRAYMHYDGGCKHHTCGGLPLGPVTLMALVRPSGLVSVSYSTLSPSRKDLNPSEAMLLCEERRGRGSVSLCELSQGDVKMLRNSPRAPLPLTFAAATKRSAHKARTGREGRCNRCRPPSLTLVLQGTTDTPRQRAL
eukprot:221625-Pelagomonas_calceolata.AAC.5